MHEHRLSPGKVTIQDLAEVVTPVVTHSKPLQPLHYLSWGLVGLVTAVFCSSGWYGWSAQLAGTVTAGTSSANSHVALLVDMPLGGCGYLSPQLTTVPMQVPFERWHCPLASPLPFPLLVISIASLHRDPYELPLVCNQGFSQP